MRLLKKGCITNGRIEIGEKHWDCALSNALYFSSPEIIALLLKYGADPNLDLGRNLTPFHHAALTTVSTMNMLYQHKGNINTLNRESGSETPLISAIDSRKIDNVNFLIKQGALVNPDSLNGYTSPLARAVRTRQIEVVQLLLDKGANINATFSEISEDCYACPYGITVMHTLVDMMEFESNTIDTKLLDLLLAHRPDLNIEVRMAALEHACFGYNINLIDKLIRNGAELRPSSTLHLLPCFQIIKW